jgi:hypothetical protein
MSQEDSVIFYPHAHGIPLSHQLHRSPRWLAAQLQIIGRALATLHNGPETLQSELKQNTFTNEAKVVKRASEHIQVLLPETYDKILEILDKVEKLYFSLPQERPTFTHSDFKSDHLLCTPQGLTLIDFDTCKLADPALDIGKFLADLEWWFTVKGISGTKEAQAELLKGYVAGGEPDHVIQERTSRPVLQRLDPGKDRCPARSALPEGVGSNDSPDDRACRSCASHNNGGMISSLPNCDRKSSFQFPIIQQHCSINGHSLRAFLIRLCSSRTGSYKSTKL